jgi:hypothetical protein
VGLLAIDSAASLSKPKVGLGMDMDPEEIIVSDLSKEALILYFRHSF